SQYVPNFSDRPYMNREVDDIDSRDAGNPLLCTGYVNDLYEHFHQLEQEYRVSGRYMQGQELVNEKMRGILVDWLVGLLLLGDFWSGGFVYCCTLTYTYTCTYTYTNASSISSISYI
ncbi:hypothetical protein EON63_19970, partial [archaeon]